MTPLADQKIALDLALAQLTQPFSGKIRCGARAITLGDEHNLTPSERAQMPASVVRVLRASASARIVARHLFTAARYPVPTDICKNQSGAPIWPKGFVGSLSHDEDFAAAAISSQTDFKSIGIDVEPPTPLPQELIDIVATPQETSQASNLGVPVKLIFCIKEAVYKCTNVLDSVYLDYHDVDVNLANNYALVRNIQKVNIYTIVSPRLVALAVISNENQ
ncbi:4'-phosphopantetheinyl transferase family protein [Novosphingobium sp. Leaf2]|uniref:4'-phosphopantetheinyl transferase family protein n=1 Tax=Novosphingobium sp. Leaf2 TaxID=1735670 RepID=UPI0009E86479|nr:4'-phosphopantetheinyl transferase superfamily protein [Novosphingobium sp. Leaf2]